MTTELDAAIFDFGGVLTTPIRASFAEFERSLGLPEKALLEAFRHMPASSSEPDFFLLERGEISEGEFYRRMHRRLCEFLGYEIEFPSEPEEVRRRMFGSLRRNDEMIATVAQIARHYKTAICSNNVKEWSDWRAMVDAHVVDLVVDSSEEGCRKPDARIYEITCARLGVEPHRAAFVDDIPSNVEGAAAVGLHAIVFTTTEEVVSQLQRLFPRAFTAEESVHA